MTVFFEDRFSTFDRDLKNKKIMVPMNPEGGAQTAPRAPRLTRSVTIDRIYVRSTGDAV